MTATAARGFSFAPEANAAVPPTPRASSARTRIKRRIKSSSFRSGRAQVVPSNESLSRARKVAQRHDASRGQRSTSLPVTLTDVAFPSASSAALTRPLWPDPRFPGHRMSEPHSLTGHHRGCRAVRVRAELEGARAPTVMDSSVSRFVRVSVLPGKTPSSLMGLPNRSVKVVSISLPSMCPSTGKEH